MNLNSLEDIKKQFSDFQELFSSGHKQEAADMLKDLLESLETYNTYEKSGYIDKDGTIGINPIARKESEKEIFISLNHVMEYYIFAYYHKPQITVQCTQLPIGEYYRAHGDLCIELGKYHAAEEAFTRAVEWNPVDLDAILGLAESYKYMNKLAKYRDLTNQAYRYCCTRATMARYYRNMGYYFLAKYQPELARDCYSYSNIYYHTDNADGELKYLEEALHTETPKPDLRAIQKQFDENQIECGPNPDTIGIIYETGRRMMQDGDTKLAKDCFSIVYDITQEKELEALLDEL